jgi:hypothetical protein
VGIGYTVFNVGFLKVDPKRRICVKVVYWEEVFRAN